MNVALYYPWVYLKSGGERIIVELTGRSRHRWTVFTNRFERAETFPELLGRHVVELSKVSVRRDVLPAGTAAARILAQRLPLDGYDALVVLCEGLGDLAVFRNSGLPRVCLCMTPLRIAFDPGYREAYLRTRGPWRRALARAAAAAFRPVDRLAWSRYDRILCISEEVRRRIVHGRLASEPAVEVVHPGIGVASADAEGRFGDYFLLPGRIMWTKNIELGIEAFRLLRRSSPHRQGFRLVVAGHVDEKSRPYLAGLRALAGEERGIEFVVSPDDAALRGLYRSCRAVLFTALNEDLGITPLEAMASGKPVIATDSGGPRETVVHGGTGYLERPTAAAFAARMAALADHPGLARSLGAAGPARAAQFSWDHFVSRMDECLDAVAVPEAAALPIAGPAAGQMPAAERGSAAS